MNHTSTFPDANGGTLGFLRIGQGYDVHKFGGDGPIVIGGETIDYEQGLLAHSDGDVLIQWALDGLGIINIPRFEVAEHIKRGKLIEVCQETPPTSVQLTCLYPHRRFQEHRLPASAFARTARGRREPFCSYGRRPKHPSVSKRRQDRRLQPMR